MIAVWDRKAFFFRQRDGVKEGLERRLSKAPFALMRPDLVELALKAAARGGGDPMVMLHPWFGCTRFWDHTVDAIPERETLVIDLYSLGGRPGCEEFATPQGLLRTVEGFADALQLERFCLVGNSMGGIAAQELASRLDGRISKLLLVGTGARIVGVTLYRRERWTPG